MSTDSTELTFVRCPSCRSLVPAVSTRCRMCGATLDASAKLEEGQGDQGKSKRVRQRTMSQPQSELSSTANAIREEEGGPPEPLAATSEPAAAEPPLMDGEDDADPLRDYMDADEDGMVEAAPAKAPVEKTAVAPSPVERAPVERAPIERAPVERAPVERAPVDRAPAAKSQSIALKEEIDENDPLGLNDEWEDAGEPPAPQKAAEPVKVSPPQQPQTPPASKAFEKPGQNGGMGASQQTAAPQEPKRQEEQRPKVVVETGPRQPGKPGLSFSKPRESDVRSEPEAKKADDAPRERQKPQEQRTEQRETKHEAREHRHEPREQRHEQRDAHREPQREQPRTPFEVKRDSQPAAQHQPQAQAQSQRPPLSPAPSQQKGAPPELHMKGRLFGWLVSYANPDGNALELREGKFFVTSASLKGNDLILNDKSISTPHAMVSIDTNGGLQIQDLMSESGVWVREKGSNDYDRRLGVFKVNHGDWVRFGDVEFLVSLIAHVGVK